MKIRKVIYGLVILCLVLSFLFFIYFFMYTYNTINEYKEVDLDELYNESNTQIFDVNGNLLCELGIKKSEIIDYNEISINMINAIVSIEDNDFFYHDGVNYKRIIQAGINNIIKGEFDQGASTITQQLVKNVYLSNEKSIKRKISEVYLSTKIEKMLTKEEILECYLNNILFCNRIYGVEKASNYFFNHNCSELSIEEASLLAGIIQLPNYYNPLINPDKAEERRNLVLLKMYENNYITEEEYNSALNIHVKDYVYSNSILEYNNSYIDTVITEIINDYGIDPYSNSIKIYTYYNPLIQNEIDKQINNLDNDNIKVGIIAIDNITGKIEGIGGSRENDEYGINYATKVNIQPGSTIKPILDYGPAIEYLNYGTGSILSDYLIEYNNGDKVKNWDNKFKGYISLRKSLSESRNIPSINLFNEVGKEKCFEFSSKIGIIKKEDIYEANAIGGFSEGYTVLEIANAYASFANMGEYIKAKTISSFEMDGIFIKQEKEKIRAMKESTAFMINNILHDVVKNSKYNIDGLYLSCKIGQTNYDYITMEKYNIPSNATKDSWYVGYTKEKTICVWCGYDNYNYYISNDEIHLSQELWKSLMIKYCNNYPYEEYKTPDNVIRVKVDVSKNIPYLASEESSIYNIYNEYFIKGTEPSLYYKEDDEFDKIV